jgi:sec-independent protein translocase protein TatA
MFGIGGPELVFIFILALLIFGPKKLPQIGRTIGKGMAEFRRASTELQRAVNSELDEPPAQPAWRAAAQAQPATAALTGAPPAGAVAQGAPASDAAAEPAAGTPSADPITPTSLQ